MKGLVSILEGSTFVVSDQRGDLIASPTEPHGLFHQDTRYLSRWELTVDGDHPEVLSADDLDYFACEFFLVPATGSIYVNADLSIRRKRKVGEGFHEDLTILNHGTTPRDLDVRIAAESDFADLFEVKDHLAKKGERYRRVENGRLLLGYRRDRFVRETAISSTQRFEVDEQGIRFRVHLEPHGSWSTCLEIVTAIGMLGQRREHTLYGHEDEEAVDPQGTALRGWIEQAPRLISSWRDLERTYRRSIVDLAALRYYPMLEPGDALPAAGLPWFMAIFGRDSILTAFQALPFEPNLAETTLRVLAAQQGQRLDEFRDEEPGKILHEMRMGELTAFEERPHSPYFGAADSTPLYLVLLDEFERWTGRRDVVKELEPSARAALEWIDRWGDRDGDGYIEYERRLETSLDNQCWKDSPVAIQFADGTVAPAPRATCEIQGYAYDAKVRSARLAREIWNDPELAARLEREAAELKRRFNQDFWLPDREYFALALDGQKRRVDALTSNIGHLLWSGIVEADKIEAVVRHLMGPRLFSGWGVRTMAEGDVGYNPIGYHIGTVWPHDNSFIALGLRHAGHPAEATRLAASILEAAPYFQGRLPEAFAGYARERSRIPVEYPTACSPQAWSAGTPLLMLRVLMGLEPMGEHLIVDPNLPDDIAEVVLLGIPGRWGRRNAYAHSNAAERLAPRTDLHAA
jgi:glycogen debranching enzyme